MKGDTDAIESPIAEQILTVVLITEKLVESVSLCERIVRELRLFLANCQDSVGIKKVSCANYE